MVLCYDGNVKQPNTEVKANNLFRQIACKYVMKKLLVYMKGYEKECIFGPLFKLLEASFELFVPLVIAAMIDNGIRQQDSTSVLRSGLLLVGLALIGLTCSITAQYFSAKAATGFTAKVKHALFAHIQELSFSELDTIGTSTLITRMTSDMNQIQNGVNLTLRLFLRSPFIVFGAMIMAFTIDIKAALIFVVVIPILSVVVFGIMLFTMPLYQKIQTRLDRILDITRENLNGIRVIRAFHKEEDELTEFAESNELLTRTQLFVGRISALMNPVTYIILNAALLILIYTGAWQVEGGVLTQGQVVALVNYMSQILVELIKLANLIISITKACACATRVSAVLDTPVSQQFPDTLLAETGYHAVSKGTAAHTLSPQPSSKEAVCFSDVDVLYAEGGAESLSHISFTAKKGQTIGIIGGTGSGKSTLVSLIPRFYDATAGTVRLNGIPVQQYPKEILRKKIGIVQQKAILFQGTIRDNIRRGKEDATDEEIQTALELAQASEFVNRFPKGLDHYLTAGGKNLSGGQRQRLSIARALVRQPEILILDDSTSALDYATDARLRQALRTLPGNPTIFLVSQRASSLMHADQIIVLEEGHMAGIGTHEELLQNCPVYQEIYASQTR